ncbi:hypothetical protein [Natronospira bacteriovora]|uniref:Lipoprotein n=1 Tax=Natronospira bacteriovora TaxID=3069753 RepID=A0ABU0W898_9GAMM|nr:hypothetical protein [Natronospira sp. AB-CW4]MDQ2070248.1 hypothetical protein [Natronospira sp. AB-CW4]
MLRIVSSALILGASLLLTACFEHSTRAFELSYTRMLESSRPLPYREDSPYAHVLGPCMMIRDAAESCTPSRLPPLGYPDGQVPDVDTVMQRVLVSHDWMGAHFEAFLESMPEDMLHLLRSVTAITISADVRPAYYSAWRGAIFIDPNYLWLTHEQRQQIDLSPDYRSDFGADLQFVFPWRYVRDNDYAFDFIPVSVEEVNPRELDDIRLSLARLMYHELAHAVDYLRPGRLSIPPDLPIAYWTAPTVSDHLSSLYPLLSQTMHRLAGVRYLGWDSNAEERALLPEDVAPLFADDRATHFYSYTTQREDQAMLFEAIMSLYHFDMPMDVAITARPESGMSNDDLVVVWGQRNRLAETSIRPRAESILAVMLPEFDFSEWLDDLPPPVSLVPGATWHENLAPDTLAPDALPRDYRDHLLHHHPQAHPH